jgi:hypothetical protein
MDTAAENRHFVRSKLAEKEPALSIALATLDYDPYEPSVCDGCGRAELHNPLVCWGYTDEPEIPRFGNTEYSEEWS